jgi:hypothetical protein
MIAYENIETQRKGQVTVIIDQPPSQRRQQRQQQQQDPHEVNVHASAAEKEEDEDYRSTVWGLARLSTSLPARVAALHYVSLVDSNPTKNEDGILVEEPLENETRRRSLVALLQMGLGAYQRLRMRTHTGTSSVRRIVKHGLYLCVLLSSCLEIVVLESNSSCGTCKLPVHFRFSLLRCRCRRCFFLDRHL